MSYVIAAPEMMTTAATDLAAIGSNVSAAHMVAAARTTSVIPAAADEVSTGIAHLFSQHAQDYQALAGKAAAFQGQFVQNLTAGAGSYTSIEAAIASLLQDLNVRADQLVSTLNALPSTLAALPSKELASLGQSYVADSPGWNSDITTAFLNRLAALPPGEAILVLLTYPISFPILFTSAQLSVLFGPGGIGFA